MRAGALVLALTASGPLCAQTPAASPPNVNAARIAISEAPVMDGKLNDAAWAKAGVVDGLRQQTPNAGEPGTERTVVRVMYDDENLYFGITAYDKEPDQIISRSMARDGAIFTSDFLRVTLDPGRTLRNGYSFQISPSGGVADELLLNNTDNLTQWDAIWVGRAARTADGWTAEIAIPFRSLSYDPKATVWGAEFTRSIRRKNENDRWSAATPLIDFQNVTQAGTISGISNVNQGLGLDIQVYGRGVLRHNWQTKNSTGIDGTAGGNAYYKITPALTGTLTYNPDFSDAPLDARQVNTTRFSLFTPETRDFFLQDVGAFEFGGRNFVGANNARPFFSRNIGLVRGTPVSIVAGGKMSGEYGGFGIGALSVLTDKSALSKGQVLSVARVTHPILDNSKIGVIYTNGDPTGLSRNSLAGGDFQYLDEYWLGDQMLQTDVYYERSFSNAKGDDDSYGVAVNLPNEPFGGNFLVKRIGRNFTPALGFANRSGIWDYKGFFEYRLRYRNAALRELALTTDDDVVTGLDGHLQTRSNKASLEVLTAATDRFFLNAYSNFEDVPTPFNLPGSVPVPAGRYSWQNVGARVQSSFSRSIAVTAEVTCCSFYDGDEVVSDVQVSWRPNAYFEFVPRYQYSDIRLPGGTVNIHIVSLSSVVNFTPDMQISLQAQYDNISTGFSFLGRYRWEFRPGDELFIAYGQSAVIPGTHFVAQSSQLSVRLGHTFRF